MTAHKFTPAQVNVMYDDAVIELARLDRVCDALWEVLAYGSEADATSPNGKNYIAWSQAADACRAHRELWGFMGMDAKQAAGVLPNYERFGC